MPLLLAADRPPQQPVMELVIGFLPILVFLALLFLMLRWYLKSGPVKLTLREKERHMEYMQKMEELTERIAKALEQNPKV
jgi:hypothetical protein